MVIAGGAGLLNRLRGGQLVVPRFRVQARLLNRLRDGQQRLKGLPSPLPLLNRLRGGQQAHPLASGGLDILNRLRGGQREILKPSTHFFKMLRQKPHCGLRSCVPFATF